MALKWLKKIFQRDRSDEARDERELPSTLALSYVEEWLADRSREPEFEKRVRSFYSSIERVAIDLDRDLKALEEAEPGEEVPPRLLKAGTAARENVSRQMRILSSKFAPPEGADLESAKEYHSAILKQLQNTVQKFGRAQKYTAALFPEEVEAVKSDLAIVNRHLQDLGDAVSEREARLGEFAEATELAKAARERNEKIGAVRAELSEDERVLAAMREEETVHQREIESWNRSEEGRRTLEERRSLEEKLREKDQIEMSMADLVSPLTKAISRVVKQDASDRITLQHRGVFEVLSTSPERALDGEISGALFELRSMVDVLGLRDKKRERIVEQIDHLLEERPLEVLKARHSAVTGEIEDLRRELSKRGRETARIKDKRDLIRQKIPALESSIEVRRRNLAAMEEKLSGDLADLKRRLEEIAGGRVEIDVGS
ncbi:hypothetical protein P0O15_11915 [Methanotrichaceae archaeon Mx]|uniref:Pneumococcal surface protein n=2 Tax=Candidatus Methanocrinis natronophilus TaxID=3033396 RepID=A0ABT5XAZ4_9EURY|nr:hypothetical protein [Candidatus Methanocrinis natronophilus]